MSGPTRIGEDLADVLERIGAGIDFEAMAPARAAYELRQRTDELLAAGIPTDLAETVASGRDEHGQELRTTAIDHRLREVLGSGSRHALLLGQPGTGKSLAAARLLDDRGYGRWVAAVDYAALSDWSQDREPFLTTGFLVVDDLGVESERQAHKIEALICHRHAERRTTVYTSNLGPKEVAARYDGRVISRLREGRGCSPLILCREPLRLQRGTARQTTLEV